MAGYRNDGGSAIVQAIGQYAAYKERQEVRAYQRDQAAENKLIAMEQRNYERGLTSADRTRRSRLDRISEEQREFSNELATNDDTRASSREEREIAAQNMRTSEYNRKIEQEKAIKASRARTGDEYVNQADLAVQEAEGGVTEAQEAIELNAAGVQQFRNPNSPNKLVGGIGFRDTGEGKTEVVVTGEDGTVHNYTTNPADPKTAKMWVDNKDIGQLEQHFNALVKNIGSKFPELSREQLFHAGFSAGPDGQVRASTEDEFVAKAAKLSPQTGASPQVAKDKAALKEMVDTGEGSRFYEAMDIATRKRLEKRIALGEDPKKVIEEAKKEVKGREAKLSEMKKSGEGTKPWELYDSAKRKGLEENIKRSKSIIAKLEEDGSTKELSVKAGSFNFRKDFPSLDAIRNANMMKGGLEQRLETAKKKVLEAKGKKQKTARWAESYALGDPSVTPEMVKNASETGDPYMSKNDQEEFDLNQGVKHASILKMQADMAAKLAKAQGNSSDDQNKRNKVAAEGIAYVVDNAVKQNGMKKEDFEDVKRGVTMALQAVRAHTGMDEGEYMSAHGITALGVATSLYAGSGSDFKSASALPSLAAATSGFVSQEGHDEFVTKMSQAAIASGKSEGGIYAALQQGKFRGEQAMEFLDDLARGQAYQ